MAELTVLMAVRNGVPYLQAAVESVLNQTYKDFVFLIVDDQSTDNTPEIVRSYNDSRVQLLCLDKNVGQTAALNRGLQEVQTPWIGRMDADDYSAPDRFEMQMKAAAANPALGCIGTFAWTFREDPSLVDGLIRNPTNDRGIKSALLWSSPLIHGTMVARTQTMKDAGGYNEQYRYSADLDLYDRLLPRCECANVPRPLLGIRRHPGQDSHSTRAIQESIEIFDKRLHSGRYSPEDAAVVQAAKHLHQALCAKIDSRYAEIVKHFAGALWWAPSLAMTHLLPRKFRLA